MITGFTAYQPIVGFKPLTQITPFTYRDGATYAQIQNHFEQWLKQVGAELQVSLDEYLVSIGETEQKWENNFNEFMDNVIEILEGLNDQAAANLVARPDSKLRLAIDVLFASFKANEVTPMLEQLEQTLNDALATMTQTINGLGNRVDGVEDELDGRLSADRMTPYYIDLRLLGAKGDGIANDTAAWQNALNYAKNGSAFLPAKAVVIMCSPFAKYRVTAELVFSKNTIVYGHHAEIIRDHSGYTVINGERGSAYSGYNGNGNISVFDLTLNANGNNQSGVGSTIAFAHAENLHWENVTVLNSTSHGYELNSQRNVTIKNCNFYGYKNANGNDFVEAIQLDLAVENGFGAFGAFDSTPCDNIRIINCDFGRSPLLGAHPRAIGSHGGRVDRPHNRITIDGCTFADHASMAIRPYNWNGLVVNNSHGVNPGGFMQINTPIVGDGTSDNTRNAAGAQTGASVANSGFVVTGCSSTSGMGVWIAGQASGRVRTVKIVDCDFSDGSGIGAVRGITGAYFDGVTVDNVSLGGFQIGIGFLASSLEYRVKLINNDVRYCYEHGIYVTNTKQLTVTDNDTYNCGDTIETGSHIRISGASDIIIANGNKGYTNGSYDPNYGLYIAGDNTNGIISNNIYRGIGKINTIDMTATATMLDSNNLK